ncbi:GntR family transcriptional regulator (plasmid) [Neorhizobium galegae]|nr:GntR family transcriptional regulator [Neorhizobium galegae]
MGEVTAIRKRRRVVQPAKPASLTEQVYDALRTQILTCVIRPGQELNEAEVAERFDISKTPAREALAALRQEGLVRSFSAPWLSGHADHLCGHGRTVRRAHHPGSGSG